MKIITRHPVAVSSVDHIVPLGAKQDNTHCPRFVEAIKKFMGKPRVLDIGCAGGGLVKDFLDAGIEAYGIEGSDYPLVHRSGEWGNVPLNLATVDVTKAFSIVDDNEQPIDFDLITAWEFFEHIAEDDLQNVFLNICGHLKPDGLCMGSVCTQGCCYNGTNYHVTVQNKVWWMQKFETYGLVDSGMRLPIGDFPRGSGNPLALGDWKGEQHGFHVILKQL